MITTSRTMRDNIQPAIIAMYRDTRLWLDWAGLGSFRPSNDDMNIIVDYCAILHRKNPKTFLSKDVMRLFLRIASGRLTIAIIQDDMNHMGMLYG